MTDETTTTEAAAPQDNNVQISIEQICAAIINTLGSVEVSLENILTDYSSKSIAVKQDETTKALTFALADAPAPVAEDAENTEEDTTDAE